MVRAKMRCLPICWWGCPWLSLPCSSRVKGTVPILFVTVSLVTSPSLAHQQIVSKRMKENCRVFPKAVGIPFGSVELKITVRPYCVHPEHTVSGLLGSG